MRCWRGALGAVLVMCMWVLPEPAAAAEPAAAEPPLAFVDAETLSVSCTELASDGVEIAIRNETGAKQRATLAPVEFSDAEGTAVPVAKVCGGLHVRPSSVLLKGAAGARVKLEGDAAREGNFSGSLALSAASGRVARRSLVITSEPIPGAATPLVESQSTERSHLDPIDQDPVWIPVNLALAELPPPPSGETPATLGALAGSNGAVAVTYSGERKRLTNTSSLIGLELGDSGPGSYTGNVDLLPDDEEAGKVTLNLTMTTWWLFPAVLLVIGVIIGVWLQRQTGLTQPEAQLLKRITGLTTRLEEETQKLREAASSKSKEESWGAFRIGNVAKLQDDLRDLVSQSTRGPIIKLDEEVLKDLKAKVAAVEAQIHLLGEIPDHAGDLESALEKLSHGRPPTTDLPPLGAGQSPQDDPRLVAKSKEALKGATVEADELKPLIEAIDAHTTQIGTLKGLEARLSEFWIAKQRLEEKLGEEKVAALAKSLRSIHELLLIAVGSEDLTSAATKLQQAAQLLADLLLEPEPAESLAMTVRKLRMSSVGNIDMPAFEIHTDDGAQVQYIAPSGLLAPLMSPSTAAPLPSIPEPRLSAGEANRKLEMARWSQAIVVVLAAVVAFSSGMQLLYVGKAWGSSFWDWLAIFAWGIAVQATVTTLATSIDAAAVLRSVRVPGR
jgi:hypothetical protein